MTCHVCADPTCIENHHMPAISLADSPLKHLYVGGSPAAVKPADFNKVLGFLGIAKAIAYKSKDRSTKIGAVVLGPDCEIRSSGWNGFPRGIDDSVEERHTRPAKYLWTAHAEENSVAQAARIGVSLNGCTMLVTELHPCTACSRMIIQAGIKRVFAPAEPKDIAKWNGEELVAMQMLSEAGVVVVRY